MNQNMCREEGSASIYSSPTLRRRGSGTVSRLPSVAENGEKHRNHKIPSRAMSEKRHNISAFFRGMKPPNDSTKRTMNNFFKVVAFFSAITWITLIALAYWITPAENIHLLEGREQNAALIAFSILCISFIKKLIPVFLFDSDSKSNGILIGSIVVQFVAMSTNFCMAFLPCPVMVDPVTKAKVYLLRWCEWTPLAFFMTFMTEAIGIANDTSGVNVALLHGAAQGLSTLCGFLFPYCPNQTVWIILMVISCGLFLAIFPRLKMKHDEFKGATCGTRTVEIESYNCLKYSYQLLFTCTCFWSTLVLGYFFSSFSHMFVAEDSVLRTPHLPMFTDCLLDVVMKVLYMEIIVDVHENVFDNRQKALRKLNELKNMMSVVWESSSDIIIISAKSITGSVSTMVSPTFKQIFNTKHEIRKKARPMNSKDAMAFLFELDPEEFIISDDSLSSRSSSFSSVPAIDISLKSNDSVVTKKSRPHSLRQISSALNIDDIVITDTSVNRGEDLNYGSGAPMSVDDLSSLGDLVVKAWTSKAKESLFTHDLELKDGSYALSEVKVSRYEENCLIIVLRDVSERFRRFEAEKKVVSETTARQKDAEANRFTRHEVKNGLLSAIELCNILKSTQAKSSLASSSHGGNRLQSTSLLPGDSHSSESNDDEGNGSCAETEVSKYVDDLGSTLHEVLDTILAEAMSREVIYEVYQPIMTCVDIYDILSNTSKTKSSSERFPFKCDPSPFPTLVFDTQLLKYIHRNAVSNACKYGKKKADVTTNLKYDFEKKEFCMTVVNLPGENHEDLLKLGDVASKSVFEKGKRLHKYIDVFKKSHKISAGDGCKFSFIISWIPDHIFEHSLLT